MTTKFNMIRDINGYNGFGLQFADDKYSATLDASSDTTLVVPDGSTLGSGHSTTALKYLAIFSYTPGTEVWVSNNATAAVPVGATFASVSSELNPTARYVSFGDTLHFITAGTGVSVGVTFYAIL